MLQFYKVLYTIKYFAYGAQPQSISLINCVDIDFCKLDVWNHGYRGAFYLVWYESWCRGEA